MYQHDDRPDQVTDLYFGTSNDVDGPVVVRDRAITDNIVVVGVVIDDAGLKQVESRTREPQG